MDRTWYERLNSEERKLNSTEFLFSLFVCFWRDSSQWARASSFTRFLDHTQRRTTVGGIPLDEWSARRRDLYLTTQHSQQTKVHAPGGIRTHNPSRRAAAYLRLRQRDHCDLQEVTLACKLFCKFYSRHLKFQEVEAVRTSALRTGRLCPHIPVTHLC